MSNLINEVIKHLSKDVDLGLSSELLLPYWKAKLAKYTPKLDIQLLIEDIKLGISSDTLSFYWNDKLALLEPEPSQPEPSQTQQTATFPIPLSVSYAGDTPLVADDDAVRNYTDNLPPIAPETKSQKWDLASTKEVMAEFRSIGSQYSYSSIATALGGNIKPINVRGWVTNNYVPQNPQHIHLIRVFLNRHHKGENLNLSLPGPRTTRSKTLTSSAS